MKSKASLIKLIALLAAILFSTGIVAVTLVHTQGGPAVAAKTAQSNLLTSKGVPTAPTLDGQADPLWDAAEAIEIPVLGGANTPMTTVRLKSIYTRDQVFFLAQWTDPTESNRRSPWQKQADGTWAKVKDPNDKGGDNNLYYEDKLAFIWNIGNSIAGFNQAGCFVTCHAGEAGKPYGNKYTANPGEIGDIWHWKGVRTNPVGQVDDQYVDDTRYEATSAPEAGRHSDPKASGGYADNNNADKTGPGFIGPTKTAPPYWIVDSEKQPFADTFNAGDEVPGIVVSPFTGDRGDIVGKGVWENGQWTLELGRKSDTGSPFDVQFSDLAATYYFGVATFDNAQVRHSFASSAYGLVFGEPATAVTEVTWGQIKSGKF